MSDQNQNKVSVGRVVIRDGIVGAYHHYIQAIQLQEKLSSKDAIGEAVKLCDDIKKLLIEEITGGSNEKEA